MALLLNTALRTRNRRGAPDGQQIRTPLSVGSGRAPGTTTLADRLDCPPGLPEEAEAAVENAYRAIFTVDPLLGPAYSHLNSLPSSVVKRHGGILEAAIAATLADSGKYRVMRNVSMEIYASTRDLLSNRAWEQLEGRSVRGDGPIVKRVFLDLVALNRQTRQAFIAEIKRGNAKSDARTVEDVDWYLRAAQLQGAAFLADLDCRVVDTRAIVLDIYGRGGFPADLTVTGRDMDALFGVPVMKVIDAVTDAMRERLHALMPGLVRAALPSSDEAAAGLLRNAP